MGLPLRVRLTLVVALGMTLVLGGAGAVLYLRLGAGLLESIDTGLRSRAAVIEASLGKGGVSFSAPPGALIEPDAAFAQVLDASGRILDASPAVSKAPLIDPETLRSITHPIFLTRDVQGLQGPNRLLAVPVAGSDQPEVVVVGATLGDRQEILGEVSGLVAIVGPLVILLVSAGGWMLAGAALRPVERMRRQAATISSSARDDRRLPVPRTKDELARLAITLNTMLGRLRDALKHERQFVDEASHELRTPLGALKTELELALSRSRKPDELRAALESALEETDRLARLAEDLLVLSRSNDGRLPIHRVHVPLLGVLEEASSPHRGRARAAGVRLDVVAPRDVVRLDPVRLRQAIENLLDNSLHHVPSGGSIRVEALTAMDTVSIAVEDSGEGFPEDLLDRAFEPLVRGGPDIRNRSMGSGLGLAIVRAVAEAHGGTARAENRPEGGARVTLVLKA